MRKISVWMLALLLVPGVVMLAGCKKAEETDNAATGEAMPAEPTPTPMMEAIPEATPMMEATPAMGDNAAAATAPAVQ